MNGSWFVVCDEPRHTGPDWEREYGCPESQLIRAVAAAEKGEHSLAADCAERLHEDYAERRAARLPIHPKHERFVLGCLLAVVGKTGDDVAKAMRLGRRARKTADRRERNRVRAAVLMQWERLQAEQDRHPLAPLRKRVPLAAAFRAALAEPLHRDVLYFQDGTERFTSSQLYEICKGLEPFRTSR